MCVRVRARVRVFMYYVTGREKSRVWGRKGVGGDVTRFGQRFYLFEGREKGEKDGTGRRETKDYSCSNQPGVKYI